MAATATAARALFAALLLSAGAGAAGAASVAAAPVHAAAAVALRPDEQAVPAPPVDDPGEIDDTAVDARARARCAPTCIVARRPPTGAQPAPYAPPQERRMH